MSNNTSCFKQFAKYASLNVLGMLGISCYILADTFFISKGLGAGGLTALNLAIPVYSFVNGCGLMLGMGGATKYAVFKGQENWSLTNIIFTNTLYFAALLSLLFVTAGTLFSHQITSILGANAEVFAMTHTYLKVILLFSPAFILNDVLLCFVRNDGNPKLSMTAMLAGSILNIVLDYIFIFPLGLGIAGAVFATGLAPLFSMMLLSLHWLKKENRFHPVKAAPDFSLVCSVLSLGFPSLIAEVSAGIVMIVFNMLILGIQGNIGVAAYGVIANLALVVTSVFTGISQGIQPLISHAFGRRDAAGIRLLFRYALITVLFVSVGIYILLFLNADWIAGVFNSGRNAVLQDIAVTGLKIYFTSALFTGCSVILSVYFTSTENPLPAHLISLLRGLFLIVPTALLMSALWGMTGIWLALPMTELLTASMGVLLYIHSAKKPRPMHGGKQ